MKSNIYRVYGVKDEIFERSEMLLEDLKKSFEALDEAGEQRQLRVLAALQHAGLTEASLGGSSGYGYDDRGRSALEEAFAEYFETESALVRHQFSSGTHVLAACLKGILRPGDELLVASGELYDTIKPTIGDTPGSCDEGSLKDFSISTSYVDLDEKGCLDIPRILHALKPQTRMVYIQKSRGYTARRALLNREIGACIRAVKAVRPELIFMVDNCYGEMVEAHEPTYYGADICAGSLIKNLGAGIAESGGYVCGKTSLVERIACQMTAPGVGSHVGPSLGHTRNLARGFFFAPQVTVTALKSALHAAALMSAEGYEVTPQLDEERGDIVQLIACESAAKLCAFCEEIQAASPVDAAFTPIPAPMPGYDCDIIMASGSFVQGSSIELSCDGPLRKPYHAYLQGGLSFAGARLGVMRAAQRLRELEQR